MNPTPDPVDVHVGARLRARRLALGQSQSELAEALGICSRQVQKCERGFNRILASMLHRAAQARGVPPAHYFEGLPDIETQPEGAEAAQARQRPTTREAWGFAEVAPQLSPNARAALLQFVRNLAVKPD